MGRTAIPLVLSQLMVVDPKGEQPVYVRSKRSIQTSAKLRRFQACMSNELTGETHADRKSVRTAFTSAAKKCKGS